MAYGHSYFEARHAAHGGTTTTARTGNSATQRPARHPKPTAEARKHYRLASGQMAERSAALAARG
jgi:hypothetical protein